MKGLIRNQPESSHQGKWSRLHLAAALVAATAVLTFTLAWFGVAALSRSLPEVSTIKNLQLQVPLRILSADGKLIGEFGAERRALLKFTDMPERLTQAFIAAEDDDFYSHGGVDYWGLLRAALKLVATGDKAQGGSTITMQLARNVFLTSEKTFSRKIREILLAQRIENELSKQEILALYLNKIYLGERAYGVGAASLIYFGKAVGELNLGEMATLAALPKAPSRDNPAVNPQRASERRNYVLRRMSELGFITAQEQEDASKQVMAVRPFRAKAETDAQFVAEMVRAELFARYGEEVYTRGFTVRTTVGSQQQAAANAAVHRALHEYDERHGWRGAEGKLTADQLSDANTLDDALAGFPEVSGLPLAVVLEMGTDLIRLRGSGGNIELRREAFGWAGFSPQKKLAAGDVVRVRAVGEKGAPGWRLAQIPQVQGAFVALRPEDGGIQALVGGYDFWLNKFNHVSQARRQAGSGFKPFLYAAGLAQGYTPASVFLDAPIVFDDPALESSWRPENYDNDFNGPMRLREALVQSRNLVSIRLLQAIGLDYARDYISRFGLPQDRLPKDLTIALGSAAFSPLELARAYAVLANGGFAVEPYLIDEIHDGTGASVFKANPKTACTACESSTGASASPAPEATSSDDAHAPRAIDPQIAWLMTSMMHDVTVRGTAAAVAQLGRSDLAGKTGTTNDETDAWFNGFQKSLVGIAWVGFDQPQPLGRGEVGGRAALPIWIDFMRNALRGVPQATLPRPSGLVDIRINGRSGKLAAAGDSGSIYEVVQEGRIPEPDTGAETQQPEGQEDLF